jgi:ribonuclease VapC
MRDPGDLVVDSSAVPAILFREDDAESYEIALADAVRPMISAASYVEVGIRLIRGAVGPLPRRRLADFVRAVDLLVAPVTEEQARIAIEAYQDFGKGGGHPAQLNYGDCFAYALAKQTGQPLLFKGEDFVHTDLDLAPTPSIDADPE